MEKEKKSNSLGKARPSRKTTSARETFAAAEAVTFQVSVLSNLVGRPFHNVIGKRTGMSINDWRLMLVIADQPGLSQADIVNATGFNKTTVSRSLRDLERFVQLRPHPIDSRKHAVYLTDEGWDIYSRSTPILLWRQDQLTRSLPPSELRRFKATLAKLIESARQWADHPDQEDPDDQA